MKEGVMILDEIVAYKKREVEREKVKMDGLLRMIQKERMMDNSLSLEKALKDSDSISLIAEIKLASPSSGIISYTDDVERRALAYEKAGASAISVITEERYFRGKPDYIPRIERVVSLPILLKDFIIDEYQIYRAKFLGAKAVLLICSILSLHELEKLLYACKEMGLSALLEVHSKEDLEKALSLNGAIIGINNRNLETFQVDLSTTLRLKKFIPEDRIVVSESGISTRKDVILMEEVGMDAILVGETLMRCQDVNKKIEELLGG